MAKRKVVIPIQTISFYNQKYVKNDIIDWSCHTYPNDKLLQLNVPNLKDKEFKVVIPIQTISFYNSPLLRTLKKSFGYRMTFLLTLMH